MATESTETTDPLPTPGFVVPSPNFLTVFFLALPIDLVGGGEPKFREGWGFRGFRGFRG